MSSVPTELFHAARRLRRAPTFTATVVLCLALGLAVLGVMGAVTDAFLLRPLPFAEPDRLFGIWKVVNDEASAGLQYFLKPTDFQFLRDEVRQVRVAAVKPVDVDVTGAGEPVQLFGGWSTAALAPILGIEPTLGRWFTEDEERVGARVAVIGEALWQRRWGGSREVLGASLVLDGSPYTVIGVVREDLAYSDGVELWMPMRDLDWQGRMGVLVVGRLKAGVRAEAARQEIRALGERLVEINPGLNANAGLEAARLQDSLVQNLRSPLVGLAAAAAAFLLIALANATSLMVARAVRGQGEAAIRHALGASRWMIARQVACEAVLLTSAAAVLGLSASLAALPWLVAASPIEMLSFTPAAIDTRVVLAVSMLGAGIAVVLSAAGWGGQVGALRWRHAASSAVRTPRRRKFLVGLVTADIAVTAVLSVASWHAVVSVRNILDQPSGIEAHGVLTAGVSAPSPWADTLPQRTAFLRRVLDEVGAIPGVESVGAAYYLPMTQPEFYWSFQLDDRPEDDPDARGLTLFRVITPGYVETLGMSVVEGRDVRDGDVEDTLRVALVNRAFAERRWPGKSAIGQRLRSTRGGDPLEVVGVVNDVRERGLARSEEPCVFWPVAQYDRRYLSRMRLVMRSEVSESTVAAALRERIREVDAAAVLFDVRPMSEIVNASVRRERFTMLLLSIFAALALAQAAAGVYGLAAYDVASRSRELGVRRALGAQRWELWRMIVGDGLRHAALGLAVGSVTAVLVNRGIDAVWDFGAAGPATYVRVSLLLLAVVAGAAWPAASRAARIDPVIALREE